VRVFVPARFVVPLAPEDLPAPAEQTATLARGKPRVILVEDNDAVRAATQTFLKFEGYETVMSASASEVEQMFERLGPGDLIIADYHLENRKTGLELLMRAREVVGFDLPAIIMSGDLPTLLNAVKSKAIARCRFLGEPVDTAELLAAIAELSDDLASTARQGNQLARE